MWIIRVILKLLRPILRIFGPVIGIVFALTVFMTSLFGNYIVTLFLPMVTIFHRHREWRSIMDRAISFWMVIPLVR
uniref:Uncharacterized protein n=1 Tax=Panagrolaimus davidi TaxID=227884 RepID=A0A914QRE5_9BILA